MAVGRAAHARVFDGGEFEFGFARAVQSGRSTGGPAFSWLPHLILDDAPRAAHLGVELGVENFRTIRKKDFLVTKLGLFESYRPIANLELKLAVGGQQWDNTSETAPYFGGELRFVFDSPDDKYIEGIYAVYERVLTHRNVEVAGVGVILHWPVPVPIVRTTAPVAPKATPVAPVAAPVTTPSAPALAPAAPTVVPATPPVAAPAPEPASAKETPAPASPTAPAPDVPATPPAAREPKSAANEPERPAPVAGIPNVRSGPYQPGSVYLGQVYRAALDRLAGILVRRNDVKLSIEGYADELGDDAARSKLAVERAEKVRAYLIEHGVDANRLVSVGHTAERAPAADESTPKRSTYRRVEIKTLAPGESND